MKEKLGGTRRAVQKAAPSQDRILFPPPDAPDEKGGKKEDMHGTKGDKGRSKEETAGRKRL